jgi:hypothetical protein
MAARIGSGDMRFSTSWGDFPARPWQVISFLIAVAIVGGWQFFALDRADARRVFDSPPRSED